MFNRKKSYRAWIGAGLAVLMAASLIGCGQNEEDDKNALLKELMKQASEEADDSVKKAFQDAVEGASEEDIEADIDNIIDEAFAEDGEEESDAEQTSNEPGSSFTGDWEGMMLVYDSKGTSHGYGVSDDWIIDTYARIYFDENGELLMDMIGVMSVPELNFKISNATYDSANDKIRVSGKLCGGDFDTELEAPGENRVLTMSGRTTGDIKSSYVIYMKRLDDEWDRSDAPMIGDKEYNIYVVNNMPSMVGQSIEERIAGYDEVGVIVDTSKFLQPDPNKKDIGTPTRPNFN
ncbi:MAG: hypothetical protein J6Y57_01485 [Lachnospiraceae bacterium]|nr:hypothetical protein [Lachnospiraceae bacterium]